MTTQPPSGTVTFLFTDIEGSTRLWEDTPEEMRDLVAEHDARFRAAIEANDGYVVKGTGDGVRTRRSVGPRMRWRPPSSSRPPRRTCRPSRCGSGSTPGRCRSATATTSARRSNRAARLMAAGHGGQVLLSGVTADLVPGLTLRNLGEHRLRDLGHPMLIWQLGTEEFPPLRTLDELPGNLPVQRTSFIGRADEVKELAALVTHERLVTLTGPGGVGKSRLALQVAAEVAPAFRDGVWFASLAALEEGALVAATILEALGVPERQGEPAVETLCAWASTREALVVIDNCEHLLTEVAAVVDRADGVIDHGRDAGDEPGTTERPGRARLGGRPALGPHSGVSRDSVELFVDRARMARADFSLTTENEGAVGRDLRAARSHAARDRARRRACARDDAGRHRPAPRSTPPAVGLERSTRPGRHRTLDAAVRWSYELLDETQRRVFDRLSVFAGPFTIEAAEAVVSGDGVDEWEVLDGILALVDKSLVVADETAAATRYRLLETMRQFGSTRT